ncbi:MAG: FecR family protein [Chitinophagaceae bacterium]|nr:FecR family protein [Chitinophagaceae bacterium]
MMADKGRLWELLAKQYDGQITGEELRELQLLLQQQDTVPYGELLSELKGLTLRPFHEDKAAKDRSLSAIMQSVREETDIIKAPRNGKRKLFGWAAAILAAALVTIFFVQKSKRSTGGEPFDRIVTKTGSKTLINLPDSSTVVLNSACQFAYNKDFGVKKREMQLTGEAYFDIHGNPDMPLIVHAGNVIIRVLGTAFNVRAYAEDSFVEATLVRGVIEVSLKTDPERKILLRPNEKIVIRNKTAETTPPADSGRSKSREEVIRVTQVEPDPRDSSYIETAWMKEKLVFRKEPFASLARRMERWYQVRIVFADTSQQSLFFTGSFEKETVGEALEALRHSAPFSYDMNGKTITITRGK